MTPATARAAHARVRVPADVVERIQASSGLVGDDRRVLADALDEIQLASKLWLLDELSAIERPDGATALVLGGWCGVLPWLGQLTNQFPVALAVSVDSDRRVCSIGRRAVGRVTPTLRFLCQDILDLDYARLAAGRQLVVINTICEHLREFARWRSLLPPGVLTVLQSNDYRGCRDHVNCVDSPEELARAAAFGRVDFQGALPLPLFTRFMVIGRT